jgi:hypothetical protein
MDASRVRRESGQRLCYRNPTTIATFRESTHDEWDDYVAFRIERDQDRLYRKKAG